MQPYVTHGGVSKHAELRLNNTLANAWDQFAHAEWIDWKAVSSYLRRAIVFGAAGYATSSLRTGLNVTTTRVSGSGKTRKPVATCDLCHRKHVKLTLAHIFPKAGYRLYFHGQPELWSDVERAVWPHVEALFTMDGRLVQTLQCATLCCYDCGRQLEGCCFITKEPSGQYWFRDPSDVMNRLVGPFITDQLSHVPGAEAYLEMHRIIIETLAEYQGKAHHWASPPAEAAASTNHGQPVDNSDLPDSVQHKWSCAVLPDLMHTRSTIAVGIRSTTHRTAYHEGKSHHGAAVLRPKLRSALTTSNPSTT
eukprot:NODE_2247_length_1251_cov_29.978369_g2046_i0.p1 GENE.NODE_2247_length_1251_cov_29.978369_g2046_i0~~NODE_2247_length_1251_cov_29.978369_g2046_i0.p1  ORF type:complete len:340 (+),score=51.06 NODE_2247_length_1251_cov_29.978369_g2046_i0:101-1021(+)